MGKEIAIKILYFFEGVFVTTAIRLYFELLQGNVGSEIYSIAGNIVGEIQYYGAW